MELESLKKLLFRNAMKGDWNAVVEKYKKHASARYEKITKGGDTALHVAVSDHQEGVVERLVEVIKYSGDGGGKKVLDIQNDRGATALHTAAMLGSVKMCYDIASVDLNLVRIRNGDGEIPLFVAALHGHKDAFRYLDSLWSSGVVPDEACFRRSKDGETILHCAIMGDFFDLALYIIKQYKDSVNWVNEYGVTPLHVLATKPSAFPSGSQLGGWKKIVYHSMFVDERKVRPVRRPLILPPHQYPDNSNTCVNFFHFLWKGIQVVIPVGNTNKKLPNNHKAGDDNTSDAENPQPRHKDQATAPLPENYTTRLNFLKLISKAVLVILGPGFIGIRKIKNKKEKHILAVQVMQELIACASMYEYDHNGGKPTMKTTAESTSSTDQDETQPYDALPDDSSELSHAPEPQQPITNTPERKEEGTKDKDDKGATKFFITTNYSVADKIMKHFPMTIQDMYGDNKNGVVLSATTKTKSKNNSQFHDTPILLAAKNGVVEMVENILDRFPIAIHDSNADGKNIMLLAVENRQPHVYRFLCGCNIIKESVFRKVDCGGNSALHLAAKLGDHKPWLIPGAALQMQWELKWYQFVKKSMPANFFPRYNEEGKTPRVIFTETHKELVADGRAWLTNTSESCSLVAALIATVAFATAATVPGGNDQNKGVPLLGSQPEFQIFAVTSLVALSCSVTSLVMFLSILTSRFQEKNFGRNLLTKLLVGLSSLFVSIAAMLVSFCAGHFFLLAKKLQYAAFPVYIVTCLPITLFAIGQFPLYMDLLSATLKKVPQRSYSVVLPS